ncbi:MAG: besA 1 [Rariglobus sp.]|jgi:predicted alpha/beta superfamily hydrolase|nr:besA 1 [Rariglobus sp.]
MPVLFRPYFAAMWVFGFLCTVTSAQQGLPSLDQINEASPLTSSRETRHDFTSKITGRTYRLMIAAPYNLDPAKSYPVVYILDGYWYFRPAVDFTTEAGDRLQSAIIVGIGYPTDDYKSHCDLRSLDLSVPADPARPSGKSEPGDCDAFLRMIQDEIKPFVEKKLPVDATKQTLYGKSFGGIAVLRQLFRNPDAYQTYVSASPAIFWNNHAVLADEPAFAQKARDGTLKLKLLITTAEGEQYRGTDPRQLEGANRFRMIDNASELAERLKVLNPERIAVTYTLFSDESHFSVSLACLGRGLSFALPPERK